MAIIYNGTQLSKLTYNGKNVDVVWVCDTSTTCCTKVFYPPEHTMAVSIICPYNDIKSSYCYGATGSFGNTTICGQQLCLYACTEYFCAYLNTSSSSLCFASLCFDTSDFIGCKLEIETDCITGALKLISRCPSGVVGCEFGIYDTSLIDDGNTRSTIISGATTCINLIASSSYVCACMCCSNYGAYFPNLVKNVCCIGTCIPDYYLNPQGQWINPHIYVRIKDSADNVILCGMYCPSYSRVVLNN